LTPPQESNPKFFQYRVELNNYPFDSVITHQFANEIAQWRPSKLMLQCLPVPSEFSMLWVDSVQLLEKMSIDLSRQIVIPFDTEGHTDQSYLGMICVLQITTYEMVYLVDCIALCDKIQEFSVGSCIC
jgi:hypothetical protein